MDARVPALLALLILAAATAAAADSPPFDPADATVRSAEELDLEAAAELAGRSPGTTWLAYRVESLPYHDLCCGSLSCCGMPDDGDLRIGRPPRQTSHFILVLARFTEGEADLVRVIGDSCEIGFGGRTVVWAGEATPNDSLALLRSWIGEAPSSVADSAILAIAHHETADALLLELAHHDTRAHTRRQALFWLGQTRDQSAAEVYQAALADPDLEVARHAVFVLGQYPEPTGIEYLARLLDQQERPELRKEALFWIAQSGAPDALEIVARILNG